MNAVDTNILIYAQDPRDVTKRGVALRLIESLEDGVLLWQVACEFVAGSRKLVPFGFTHERAWHILKEIRTAWAMALPDQEVLDRTERLMQTHSLSFWDATIVAACLRVGILRLYSEDFGDPPPSINGLEIVNPFRGKAVDIRGEH